MSKVQSIDTARAAREEQELDDLLAIEESGLQRAERIGELLVNFKDRCPHGTFETNLRLRFPKLSSQRASEYMRIHRAKSPLGGDLTVKEAIARAPSQVKNKPKKVATTTLVGRATGKQIGGQQKRKLKAAGIDVDARLEEGSAEAEEVTAKASAILHTTTVAREDLSLSMQQKYDRALAKALLDQKAEHEATFWAKVREEVKQRLPKEKADALQAIKDYGTKIKGVAAQMSLDDYRFVCRVLHPDRQPSEEERAKAFSIMRKLDNYITVANR